MVNQKTIVRSDAEALPAGHLVSVQVGMPRQMTTTQGRLWESAIVKSPIEGAVPVGKENLAGDAQANRKYHGGPDKAICVYCAEHYPVWRESLSLGLPFGAFGENFTVEGLTEDIVCIGDVLSVGTTRLQVTQPRQPCANIIRRWGQPDLPRQMQETGWTGFYFRVRLAGEIAAGQEVTVVERPHPGWTLLRANRLMYGDPTAVEEITALRALRFLSAEWKRILGRKLRRAQGAA
jgi:MOSC domain-containing protein YiiM